MGASATHTPAPLLFVERLRRLFFHEFDSFSARLCLNRLMQMVPIKMGFHGNPRRRNYLMAC